LLVDADIVREFDLEEEAGVLPAFLGTLRCDASIERNRSSHFSISYARLGNIG
jgi:hypothetical protein